MELKIKRMKQLAGGAQADVYQIRLDKVRGKYFCEKTRKILNNPAIADKALEQMYGEFVIAKDLNHPNIVKYEYFMKTYDKEDNVHEFHILIEFMKGDDMDVFLKRERPYMIQDV